MRHAKKPTTYEVTLRRDVQQVAHVHVDAFSRQEAIFVAESIVDNDTWNVEKYIGTHGPEVRHKPRRLSHPGINSERRKVISMAEARTYSNRSVAGQSVKKSSTQRRPKVVASDKVKTTGRQASVVRATSSTTRRGNSSRTGR